MNCLLCGRKLAIFRKSSIGDFCSLDHRALYLAEQSDAGVARLAEFRKRAPHRHDQTPALSGFVREETRLSFHPARCRGYLEPIATDYAPNGVFGRRGDGVHPRAAISVTAPLLRLSKPAARVPAEVVPFTVDSAWRPIAPGACQFLQKPASQKAHGGRPACEPKLQLGALLVPWSAGARHTETFSLAPLVAAMWARAGAAEPLIPEVAWMSALKVALPTFSAEIEYRPPEPVTTVFQPLPPPVIQIRAFELPPPRRLDVELEQEASQPPPPPEPLSQPQTSVRHVVKPWRLPQILFPKPDPLAAVRSARAAREQSSDETYPYYEPNVPQVQHGQMNLQALLSQFMPSMPTMLGFCSLLFLLLATAALISVPRSGATNSSPLFSPQAASGRFRDFRNLIRGRAAIEFNEDFRSGLSDWVGPLGWSKDWAYDQAGFLRTGKIGLWRKSLPLTNYRMEFLGQIERKSIGWVFRASDPGNYYGAKITIVKPGPLPIANLVHYAVVGGKQGPKISTPLPFSIRNDTIYQVTVDIRNDHFTTKVNGRIVDSWTDTMHRAGGVGFASESGEIARVRWLKVADKDDFVGKVCAFLTASVIPGHLLPTDEVLSAHSYFLDSDPTP